MATLEDLNNELLNRQENEQGFVQKFGEVQDTFLRNFNTGLARLAGFPSAIADLVGKTLPVSQSGLRERITGEVETGQVANILPDTRAIQEAGAELGLTFGFGEEPQDLASRIIQNIGTSAPLLPFFGPAALGIELAGATGGAVGGKVLEGSEFGQRNPELARGIGELAGGLTAAGGLGTARAISSFFGRGGTLGVGKRVAEGSVRGLVPTAEERATRQVLSQEATPDIAIAGLRAARETPEGQLLTPAQAAGTPGVSALSQAVEEADPSLAATFARQRIDARNTLKTQFESTGDIQDARNFLDANLTKRANEANEILKKVETSSSPAALSTAAEKRISLAYTESRTAERELWNALPESETISAPNILALHENELRNLTEGADPGTVSAFSRGKLGSLKTVKDETGKVFRDAEGNPVLELSGGVLLNKKKQTTTPKALHQYYSALGEKMAKLSRQGGNANRIRIMREMREAILEDLDAAGLQSQYTDAIDFSRELNQKFTSGPVGRVLGLTRGEAPLSRNSLSEIVGAGGETAREGVAQALRGTPGAKKGIEDFLKTQFLASAQNPQNKKINVSAGNKFIESFGDVLDDFFPELKTTFEEAISTQRKVDDFLGVPQVAELSPLVKDKAAASAFLGGDPGEEIGRLINNKGIERTNYLSDLVKQTKEDTSGAAFRGLQNGFTREIIRFGEQSGKQGEVMLKRISELEPLMKRTGLFKQPEVNRLKRIADTLKKIDTDEAIRATPGGVISDVPSRLFANGLRIIAVRLSSKLNRALGGGRNIGGSLQTANIAAGLSQDFANSLTNDQAKALLMKAVTDPKLMEQLLSGTLSGDPGKLKGLFGSLLNEAKRLTPKIPRPPVSAIAPGTVSAAGTPEETPLSQSERSSLIEELLQLQTQ